MELDVWLDQGGRAPALPARLFFSFDDSHLILGRRVHATPGAAGRLPSPGDVLFSVPLSGVASYHAWPPSPSLPAPPGVPHAAHARRHALRVADGAPDSPPHLVVLWCHATFPPLLAAVRAALRAQGVRALWASAVCAAEGEGAAGAWEARAVAAGAGGGAAAAAARLMAALEEVAPLLPLRGVTQARLLQAGASGAGCAWDAAGPDAALAAAAAGAAPAPPVVGAPGGPALACGFRVDAAHLPPAALFTAAAKMRAAGGLMCALGELAGAAPDCRLGDALLGGGAGGAVAGALVGAARGFEYTAALLRALNERSGEGGAAWHPPAVAALQVGRLHVLRGAAALLGGAAFDGGRGGAAGAAAMMDPPGVGLPALLQALTLDPRGGLRARSFFPAGAAARGSRAPPAPPPARPQRVVGAGAALLVGSSAARAQAGEGAAAPSAASGVARAALRAALPTGNHARELIMDARGSCAVSVAASLSAGGCGGEGGGGGALAGDAAAAAAAGAAVRAALLDVADDVLESSGRLSPSQLAAALRSGAVLARASGSVGGGGEGGGGPLRGRGASVAGVGRQQHSQVSAALSAKPAHTCVARARYPRARARMTPPTHTHHAPPPTAGRTTSTPTPTSPWTTRAPRRRCAAPSSTRISTTGSWTLARRWRRARARRARRALRRRARANASQPPSKAGTRAAAARTRSAQPPPPPRCER
jgi:hypothetical protein